MKRSGTAAVIAASGASGLLFGVGLHVAGMTSTRNVRGFLDLLGDWDPRLMIVMAAALVVVIPGEHWLSRRAPVFAESHELPGKTQIDRWLLGGAALFGIGWGLVGLCPGPLFVVLGSLRGEAWMFAGTFVAGLAIAERVIQRARA